jgi:transposase-like protein
MENDRIIKKQRISIRYSDEFKKTVVREVLDGLSKDGASRKYGIGGHTTVLRWIRQYENLPMIEPVQENQPRQIEKSFKYIESENRRQRKERELIKLKVRE